jgi:hypothetical protein
MSTREINVNDVWRRREPLGDTFDEIVVRGCVDHASFRPSVWVITSATDFGPVLQTTASGILDSCDLVSSGDPEADWTSDVE